MRIAPSDKTRANGEGGVAALERGLRILKTFTSKRDTLSLAELAELTGLHKSTLLRLSASLIRFGFLCRLEDGRFRVGPALFQLGRVYQSSFHLGDAVLPVLRSLTEKIQETAAFFVRDAGGDTCLFRVDSPHPVRDSGVAVGDRFPFDDSASSRVLSAFSELAGNQHQDVRRELVVVSRRSLRVPGVSAIVSPVFGVDQKLVGVLLVSGPEFRFTEKAIKIMKAVVVEHAANLTRTLGGSVSVFKPVLAK